MLKKVQKLLQSFFIRFGSRGLFWHIGVCFYRLGLFILLVQFRSCPGVRAVYSKSRFDTFFLPGRSDIDLVIIMSVTANLYDNFLLEKKMKRIISRTCYFFPFFEHCPIFDQSLMEDYEIFLTEVASKKNHEISNWKLISGAEVRKKNGFEKKIRMDSSFCRNYNSLVYLTYVFYGRERVNLRAGLKFFVDMVEMIAWVKEGEVIHTEEQLMGYLDNFNLDKDFRSALVSFYKANHYGNARQLVLALFYILKIMETLPDKIEVPLEYKYAGAVQTFPEPNVDQARKFLSAIPSRFLSAACLSGTMNNGKYALYCLICLESMSADIFDEFFSIFVANTPHLSEFDAVMKKLSQLPEDSIVMEYGAVRKLVDIFPLLLTGSIINSGYFCPEGRDAPIRDVLSHNSKILMGELPVFLTHQPSDFADLMNPNWASSAQRFRLLHEKRLLCWSWNETKRYYEKYYGKFPCDDFGQYQVIKKQMKIAHSLQRPENI